MMMSSAQETVVCSRSLFVWKSEVDFGHRTRVKGIAFTRIEDYTPNAFFSPCVLVQSKSGWFSFFSFAFAEWYLLTNNNNK